LELLESAAKNLPIRIFHHPWTGYGQQKNFAQTCASHDWVFNIDADEEVPPILRIEIENALSDVSEGKVKAHGFYLPRKTFYLGKWIRHGGWYPNHLVRLAHRSHSKWTEPPVHEQLRVNGNLIGLKEPLFHHAFSSIHEQILTNLRFSRLGSEKLKKAGQKASVSKLIIKPVGKFIETYLVKKGFMDGLPGFIISINASHSIFLKYAYLTEEHIKSQSNESFTH
jgi:glycosyltransferase involved in cell wall biosynthesis